MEQDLRLGSTVWIEHAESGDILYKVKLIHFRQMSADEVCKVCAKGKLRVMGTLVQYGILDDKLYTVAFCPNCKNVTVFINLTTSEYRLNGGEENTNA